jgi:uncharacterized repeat protein (TIGR03803 family)
MATLDRLRSAIIVCVLGVATAMVAVGQTFTKLLDFEGADGNGPSSETLLQGADGGLYGTTSLGGDLTCDAPYGCGTIFRLAGGRVTTLHTFEFTDGNLPVSGIIQATDGNFYGTTEDGGDLTCNAPYGCGTVFRLTPSGTLTTLHEFEQVDGLYIDSPLIEGIDGNLYGVASSGGANGYYGTVFKITLAGSLTVLHSFDGADGNTPAGLMQASNGMFYGMTGSGGSSSNCLGGCGTIYKITSQGALTTLHNFDSSDGHSPLDALIQANDGNFYGTTEVGGPPAGCPGNGSTGCGTIFQFTVNGTLTTIYTFCSQTNCSDGNFPAGPLVQGTDGNLYGTTYEGGNDSTCDAPHGCGTVFKITLGGALTTLHSFRMTDGESPVGGLLQSANGQFYATTRDGGRYGDGTIFSLDMGLAPFATFVRAAGGVGGPVWILGEGFTGTTAVSFNGIPAEFTVRRDTFLTATVPSGATTGFVTVTSPGGTLTSNVPFQILP